MPIANTTISKQLGFLMAFSFLKFRPFSCEHVFNHIPKMYEALHGGARIGRQSTLGLCKTRFEDFLGKAAEKKGGEKTDEPKFRGKVFRYQSVFKLRRIGKALLARRCALLYSFS